MCIARCCFEIRAVPEGRCTEQMIVDGRPLLLSPTGPSLTPFFTYRVRSRRLVHFYLFLTAVSAAFDIDADVVHPL